MAFNRELSCYIRVQIFILGLAVLIFGLDSYFTSTWMTEAYKETHFCNSNGRTVFGYDVCHSKAELFNRADKDCPSIAKERFFVSIIVITFVISLLGFCVRKAPSDVVYHAIASVLLLISGILYIVSAEQIDDILKWVECRGDTEHNRHNIGGGMDYRKSEKIVSGILTILLALLHGIMSHARAYETNQEAESQTLSPTIASGRTP